MQELASQTGDVCVLMVGRDHMLNTPLVTGFWLTTVVYHATIHMITRILNVLTPIILVMNAKFLIQLRPQRLVILDVENHPIMEKGSASAMVGVYAGGDGLDPMLATLKMVVTRIDLLRTTV